jgi:hypothetical protein
MGIGVVDKDICTVYLVNAGQGQGQGAYVPSIRQCGGNYADVVSLWLLFGTTKTHNTSIDAEPSPDLYEHYTAASVDSGEFSFKD